MAKNRVKIVSILILSLSVSIGFNSCKIKKRITKGKKLEGINTELIKKIRESEIDYTSIEIKASTKTDALGKKYSFNITYRNRRDSIIWISARVMLGIEAARIICTPDSVWMISRLARIEEKGDWSTMTDLVGYPLDFNTLQALFTRRIFIPGECGKNLLENYVINGKGKGVLLTPDYTIEEQRDCLVKSGFMPQFLLAEGQMRLERTRIMPEDGNWMMDFLYGENAVEQFYGLPERIAVSAMDQDQNLTIDLKIMQVNLNTELKFAFPWF
ncbi:MAG: DUF4292 domain-containing protein [Bacteroidetes bacterium]|jgi:hypothetical protein|nr:DUF4292 domain-containing protein [Bacteroidota bacterium]MBT3749881.1 DUF4292 domain-containing protein [Bacteroidota bacterium]MBT4398405.1 DUF4292 domain-containing protein [Bacteroidota bacterium]MBT4411827.1 DUF4292 domain-containing protein [Bacteroidota bacterium]MBT7462747.1 DUF4292 domain-containing protein [Bacteroidota bacterium]